MLRALIVLFLCLGSPAWAGGKVALLIGNGAYLGVPALVNPGNDVDTLSRTLQAAGFEVLSFRNQTRAGMSGALSAFEEKARGAEIALVFYSGHGIEVSGANYLVPTDAKLASDRDVKYEAIALDDVMAALDGATKLKLVLLDACRDNPFAASMKRQATKGVPTKGLARIDGAVSAANMLVSYATAPGQVAQDGDGANSPFTLALAAHLTEPGVEVEAALRNVAADVFARTKGQQRPYKTGSMLEAVALGAGGAAKTITVEPAAAPQPAPVAPVADPDAAARAAFQNAKAIGTVAEWDHFLQQFPTGRFTEAARQERNRLVAMAPPPAPTPQPAPIPAPVPAPVTLDFPKPGFCGSDFAPISILICGDPDMAAIDLKLESVYRGARLSAPDPAYLKQRQIAWINERERRCNMPARGNYALAALLPAKPCLIRAAQERILDLQQGRY